MKNLIISAMMLGASATVMASPADVIKLNQVGYYPNQEKIVVVEGNKTSKIIVTNEKGEKVMTAKRLCVTTSPISGKKRSTFDLSSIKEEGTYTITAGKESMTMTVKDNALTDLSEASIKSFYYQRSGMALTKEYAGKWARPAAHPDTHVMIHPAAASANRPAGTIISSPKGWYDAGDYNKYTTNSSFAMGVMYGMYELVPEYYNNLKVNIPEKNNSTPDLLDENMYNLEWLFTMQDVDGGCYHKLTTPSFEGFIKPSDCKQQRYMTFKSVTGTFEFAALMAKAARIYAGSQDYPGTDIRAINAARMAYEWAKKNPDALYHQNDLNKQYDPDVTTGAYDDEDFKGEQFWAAVELYLTTGEAQYLNDAKALAPNEYSLPVWGETSMLGAYALMGAKSISEEAKPLYEQQKALLLNYVNTICSGNIAQTSFYAPYGNKNEDFMWGSLSEGFGAQGLAMLYAYHITGNQEYYKMAQRDLDAILGRNATGYCYVTGFGVKSPMNPHHRISASDGIDEPVPGLIVGGPNAGQQDKGFGIEYPSNAGDESYADVLGSYASNEIAINWNATLVALLGGIEGMNPTKK